MFLAYAVAAGSVLALAFGGRLRNLAAFRFRMAWLIFAAVATQIVAFPFAFLPWTTSDGLARALWLCSYGALVAFAFLNRKIPGVPIVAAGIALNLVAIISNGGHMPVTAAALRGADRDYELLNNSAAVANPHLPWLVDRWAVPDWVPYASVFSLGDVLIGIGAAVIVFCAMETRLPQMRWRKAPRWRRIAHGRNANG